MSEAAEKCNFKIYSETGALKQVMLGRPGKEINRLTVDNMDELLFDDLLWLERAKKEHDNFANILRDEGAEVLYFTDCLANVIENHDVRRSLLHELFAIECLDSNISANLMSFFNDLPASRLAEHLIAGYSKKEVSDTFEYSTSLMEKVQNGSEFIIHPLPNLYFQRDPAMFVANGVILGQMTFEARRVEPLYWKYIAKYHKRFEGMQILFGEEKDERWPHKIEGGDLLVASKDTLVIGVSQRTSPATVQFLGSRLAQKTPVRHIFAFEIPRERYCMHLDTVFTMVDKDAFCIYPPILESLRVWKLDYDADGSIISLEEKDKWDIAIADAIGVEKLRIIKMNASGDSAKMMCEQWHDGCNTFAVAPGRVIVYNRNLCATRTLRDNGIEVLELEAPELGRGRGGPRCMSMPLNREII